MFEFFNSHAGKAVAGVVGSVLMIIWPPALPWVVAVALLQFGVRHLVLAFKEMESDEQDRTGTGTGAPSLPSPDGERRIAGASRDAPPARLPTE